jgi:hypothetical protein
MIISEDTELGEAARRKNKKSDQAGCFENTQADQLICGQPQFYKWHFLFALLGG